MVLWTRLTGLRPADHRCEVQWELAHDEAFARIVARGSESAEAD
jgi:phosphodiesterase/alkaline phosphatase D-like protein